MPEPEHQTTRRRRANRGRVFGSMRILCAVFFVLALALAPAGAQASPPEIFTSLEAPPTPEEVRQAFARGVRTFEMDFDKPGATEAIAEVRKLGGRAVAYHVGGGGGRAWGSVKAGEFVRKYNTPEEFTALTADVARLVAMGASLIHFDNTHRMSGKRLEAIVDAIQAGGAGFVAKNNPSKWRLVMKRRPDLRPAYAVIEEAMTDEDLTQEAYELHERGVPVYIVGFRKVIDKGAEGVTDDYAKEYAVNNPWATVLLMDDEQAYDSRTGVFVH